MHTFILQNSERKSHQKGPLGSYLWPFGGFGEPLGAQEGSREGLGGPPGGQRGLRDRKKVVNGGLKSEEE